MTITDTATLDELEPGEMTALARLGRALHLKEPDLQSTLDAIVGEAVNLIGPAEFAGVNLVVRGKFLPQAASTGLPADLDAIQQESGLGPCVEASRTQTVVRVDHMPTEIRWIEFRQNATAHGVLSMLCVPLWVDDLRLGSLSLYASAPGAFTRRDEWVANLFATQAALALADAQRTANLRAALLNRDTIGQAKGVLIERFKITPQRAFDLLSAASQRHNRKLIDIAESLVQTGELPA